MDALYQGIENSWVQRYRGTPFLEEALALEEATMRTQAGLNQRQREVQADPTCFMDPEKAAALAEISRALMKLGRHYDAGKEQLAIRYVADLRERVASGLEKAERLRGGEADGKSPRDFNQEQLRVGVKVEREHSSDPKVAQEIAMDHLTEDPKYYEKLAKIEKSGTGEGSRGGKVIGHTSGGEPIYSSQHEAAIEHHKRMQAWHQGLAAAAKDRVPKGNYDKAAHMEFEAHSKAATEHRGAAFTHAAVLERSKVFAAADAEKASKAAHKLTSKYHTQQAAAHQSSADWHRKQAEASRAFKNDEHQVAHHEKWAATEDAQAKHHERAAKLKEPSIKAAAIEKSVKVVYQDRMIQVTRDMKQAAELELRRRLAEQGAEAARESVRRGRDPQPPQVGGFASGYRFGP